MGTCRVTGQHQVEFRSITGHCTSSQPTSRIQVDFERYYRLSQFFYIPSKYLVNILNKIHRDIVNHYLWTYYSKKIILKKNLVNNMLDLIFSQKVYNIYNINDVKVAGQLLF